MENHMVERVARDLHRGFWARNNRSPCPELPEEAVAIAEMWRWIARAAIEAMREPTDAMLDAGVDCADGCTDGWTAQAPCIAEHLWAEMVEAALSGA